MGEGGHYDKPSTDQKPLYLQHFPGWSVDFVPLVVEKVGEENVGEQPGRLRRRLAEGVSPTEKSVTVSSLTQGVSGTLEHEYPVLLFWAKSQPWLGFGGGGI